MTVGCIRLIYLKQFSDANQDFKLVHTLSTGGVTGPL